jgi:cell division protein FtsB
MARRRADEVAVPDEPAAAKPRYRMLYLLWAVVVIAVAGGVLLVLVLPTRAWLDQRAEVAEAERQLAVLEQANDELEARVAALQTPAEVERVARDQYNLVRPGEQVYSVLPAALPQGLPPGWPFDLVGQIVATRGTLGLVPAGG